MPDNPGAATGVADAIQALTVILRRDLEHVWARVGAEVTALEADWPAMGAAARRRRLLELQTHIAALADAADEIAARHVLAGVRDSYLLGAHATALTVGGAVASTGVDLDAITALALDTHQDLLAATKFMRTSTKDLIRTLARDHVSDRLYTGRTATQAGRELARALRAHSVAAVVYKDGSRHGLGSYSDMVLRTKTAEAYQVGGFNQAASHGVKFVEVMDGPGCGWTSHDDTTQANGMIMTLDDSRAYPISHPNCRRVTIARPDIKSLDGATPKGPQFTAQQLKDAAAGSDVGFRKVVDRRGNATMAPAASIARGPAAARQQALLAKASRAAQTPSGVAKRLVASATTAEPKLTALTSQLAQKHGAEMAGLDFRLKGAGSLERKIAGDVAGKGMTAAESGAKMFDVNRYTMVIPESRYATGAQSVINDLHAQGNTLNVKNYWNSATNPYQGVNVQVVTPVGDRFELQFHTPTSLAVKEGEMHTLYEASRIETNQVKIDAYTAQSFAVSAKIPVPSGIQGVGLGALTRTRAA